MKQANQANPNEFQKVVKEPKREATKLGDLPSSEKESFWGKDAEVITIDTTRLIPQNQGPHGKYRVENGYVICEACENPHTIPEHTLNSKGELVKLDKLL